MRKKTMLIKKGILSKQNGVTMLHLLLLAAVGLGLIRLMVPPDRMFGSSVDWYSQHVTIVDAMRKEFYASGNLLPDWTPLGSGSNFFSFSYYGFLRPDVLLSFALPGVAVETLIQGYAIFEMIAGAWLLYWWVRRHGIERQFCFMGGILYLTSGCLFQAHRQIMFVNYLPYLILALLCLDGLRETVKRSASRGVSRWFPIHLGLTLSLGMVLFHSFYFFPSCFVCCLLYFQFGGNRPGRRQWAVFLGSVTAAVSLAMVLLLPTALAILENEKDVKGTEFWKLFTVNPSLNNLLYGKYGCGLTALCLYGLLLAIRRRQSRILAVSICVFFSCPLFYWILNGTLYARPKAMIPFMPLVILMTMEVVQEIRKGRMRHSVLLAVVSVLPVLVQVVFLSDGQEKLMMADAVVVVLFAVTGWELSRYGGIDISEHVGHRRFQICRVYQNICLPKFGVFRNRRTPFELSGVPGILKALRLIGCVVSVLLLCVVPVLLCLDTAKSEDFVKKQTDTREVFSEQELRALCTEENAAFDMLSAPMTDSNYVPFGGLRRTTMYSSVSNSLYNRLFYDILKMPVSNRNRVALTGNENPFQEYLMGVRYLQGSADRLPEGYEILAEKDGQAIAENPCVLPVAYGSTALMGESDFDMLNYPQTLEALVSRTVVPGSGFVAAGTASGASGTIAEEISGEDSSEISKESSVEVSGESFEGISGESSVEISEGVFQSGEASQMKKYALPERFMEPITKVNTANDVNTKTKTETIPDSADSAALPQVKTADNRVYITNDRAVTVTKPLPSVLKHHILLLSFDVEYQGKADIDITINGIRNRLSGSSAPYPNRNTTFTYMISQAEPLKELNIRYSKGNYQIDHVQAWTFPVSGLSNPGVVPFYTHDTQQENPSIRQAAQQTDSSSQQATRQTNLLNVRSSQTGNLSPHTGDFSRKKDRSELLRGTITMDQDGYFVTSFAYSNGYQITIDGKSVTPVLVNKAFVGAPLSEGTHEITVSFRAPGKTIGLLFSLGTLVYLAAGVLLPAAAALRRKSRAPRPARLPVPVPATKNIYTKLR